MPKHFREETDSLAEGLDGEWVGRCVMLKPAAATGQAPARDFGREDLPCDPQRHDRSTR